MHYLSFIENVWRWKGRRKNSTSNPYTNIFQCSDSLIIMNQIINIVINSNAAKTYLIKIKRINWNLHCDMLPWRNQMDNHSITWHLNALKVTLSRNVNIRFKKTSSRNFHSMELQFRATLTIVRCYFVKQQIVTDLKPNTLPWKSFESLRQL